MMRERRLLVWSVLLVLLVQALTVRPAYAIDTIPQLDGDASIYSAATALPIKVQARMDQNDARNNALRIIRTYRQEALNQGLVSLPSGMSRNDYLNGIYWNADLERIAIARAVESSFTFNHVRMSYTDPFECESHGIGPYAEILAWWWGSGGLSIERALDMWYEEKPYYEQLVRGQMPQGEYGHYETLISPEYSQYGFSTVEAKGVYCAAGEAGWEPSSTPATGYSGTYYVSLWAKDMPGMSWRLTLTANENPLMPGASTGVTIRPTLTYSGETISDILLDSSRFGSNMKLTSSNTGVLSVSGSTLTGVKEGTADVTVRLGGKGAATRVQVATTRQVYRLYNTRTSEHLYTTNKAEYDTLPSRGNGDWRQEGVAWTAPVKSAAPVYRLYNAGLGDHHYTANKAERDNLIANHGWRDEGICWYSDTGRGRPLYRVYNGRLKAGQHHYTANVAERDMLVSRYGWREESIGWYGTK